MVEAGSRPRPRGRPTVRDIFTKYRKTHNDGIFDLYTPEILECRRSGIITGLRMPTAAAASSATIAVSPSTAWTG